MYRFLYDNGLRHESVNHQKRQLVDLLKEYLGIIYVTNCLECKFQKFKLK